MPHTHTYTHTYTHIHNSYEIKCTNGHNRKLSTTQNNKIYYDVANVRVNESTDLILLVFFTSSDTAFYFQLN